MHSGLFFILCGRKSFLSPAERNIKIKKNHGDFIIGFFAAGSSYGIFEENDRYAGIR